MWNMTDVYNVMEYLNWSNIDREMPIEIGKDGLKIDKNNISVPTIWEDFNKISVVEIYFKDKLPDNPQIIFSSFEDGSGEILKIDSFKSKENMLVFTVSDDSQASKRSRALTGIHSLKLLNMMGTVITRILFRTEDYNITLNNIETQLTNAESDILDSLGSCSHNKVPKSLERQIYKLAAAYCWQILWENETQGMNIDKNYASRMMEQVNNSINSYILNHCNNDVSRTGGGDFVKVRWGL